MYPDFKQDYASIALLVFINDCVFEDSLGLQKN